MRHGQAISLALGAILVWMVLDVACPGLAEVRRKVETCKQC